MASATGADENVVSSGSNAKTESVEDKFYKEVKERLFIDVDCDEVKDIQMAVEKVLRRICNELQQTPFKIQEIVAGGSVPEKTRLWDFEENIGHHCKECSFRMCSDPFLEFDYLAVMSDEDAEVIDGKFCNGFRQIYDHGKLFQYCTDEYPCKEGHQIKRVSASKIMLQFADCIQQIVTTWKPADCATSSSDDLPPEIKSVFDSLNVKPGKVYSGKACHGIFTISTENKLSRLKENINTKLHKISMDSIGMFVGVIPMPSGDLSLDPDQPLNGFTLHFKWKSKLNSLRPPKLCGLFPTMEHATISVHVDFLPVFEYISDEDEGNGEVDDQELEDEAMGDEETAKQDAVAAKANVATAKKCAVAAKDVEELAEDMVVYTEDEMTDKKYEELDFENLVAENDDGVQAANEDGVQAANEDGAGNKENMMVDKEDEETAKKDELTAKAQEAVQKPAKDNCWEKVVYSRQSYIENETSDYVDMTTSNENGSVNITESASAAAVSATADEKPYEISSSEADIDVVSNSSFADEVKYLVPKMCKQRHGCCWKVSTMLKERQLITQASPEHREAYKLMKFLFTCLEKHEKGFEVTSYMLKTCLLYHMKYNCCLALEKSVKGCLHAMLRLMSAFYKTNNIPNFFNKLNLLQRSHILISRSRFALGYDGVVDCIIRVLMNADIIFKESYSLREVIACIVTSVEWHRIAYEYMLDKDLACTIRSDLIDLGWKRLVFSHEKDEAIREFLLEKVDSPIFCAIV